MSDTPIITASVDPQVNSHLVQIPLEILIRITYFISTVDLGNVRLSCKALEQSLFNFFSYEFFRKKQFMVTSDSLQALIDIAKHPTLGPCLKHVIISTERPSIGARLLNRHDERRARLELANADHMHLLATGGLRDMLVEAFTHLTNIDTVDIRDFNATSRNRDGRGTPWRSYGAVSLERSTNAVVSTVLRGPQDMYSTQLFSAVTAALATAQARPRSLEVLLRSHSWEPFAIQDAAFYIPPRLEGSMASLLSSLKSLHLTLASNRDHGVKPFIFQKFLSLASNLTWLRLNFSRTTREEDIQDILPWLALRDSEKPTSPLDMQPIQLRHLERLDLGTVETDAETLVGLVAKFAPTLTSLYLRRVSLFNPQNSLADRINPWVRCLSAISRIPDLKLRTIDFSSVTHSCGHWRGAVSFKDVDSFSGGWTCTTNLVTLDKAIAQAVEAMTADWPQPPEPDPMDEDSEEDSEQEEGDDGEGEGESDGEEES